MLTFLIRGEICEERKNDHPVLGLAGQVGKQDIVSDN